MSTQQRNRIIYQSQALFISPSSTGYHLQQCANTGPVDTHGNIIWTGVTGVGGAEVVGSLRSLTQPLERIQSINFNLAVNREDINEMGKLARLGSLVMESPTVSLDFNYYLTNGGNERKMGFNVPTNVLDSTAASRNNATSYYSTGDLALSGYNALSGLLEDNQGNNYFILVSKEGLDVHGDTKTSSTQDFDVISIGNGFISSYSMEAAVGSIPQANVSVEAFNIKVDDLMSGTASTAPLAPFVSPENGEKNASIQFVIQGSEAFNNPTLNTTGINGTDLALRPGDITFSISNSGSYQGFTDLTDDGEAHIQSVSISVPLARNVLPRLGSTFGYARVINTPFEIEVSVSAIVSELKTNNLYDKLCGSQTHDFTLTLYGCDPTTGGRSSKFKMQYIVKGARWNEESFANAVGGGDGETVDMTFTCQAGGANDTLNGIFINGSYPLFRVLPYFPLGKLKDDDASYRP